MVTVKSEHAFILNRLHQMQQTAYYSTANSYLALAESTIVQQEAAIAEKDAEIAALKARIDALMLEHCPDEMTVEQRVEWGKHQVPAHTKENCE